MRRKNAFGTIANVLAVVCLALLATTAVFCVRAQFDTNDYVELKSNDMDGPPEPNSRAQWNEAEWSEWADEYKRWDRSRWSVHVRANRNAIFAFGR